ncbi:MAG: 30S ribosome-binding factor RbfA [Oscillospiraceae bacterium]|jgi:ribosome-binding factor A|nr:30S ribosome-binding factor RbfA [Oscillospiraceae bacterium]
MPNFGLQRTEENIKRELTDILRNIKDHRVANNMVSIVDVVLSADFAYAKIYIRSLLQENEEPTMLNGLNSATGFVRVQLGQKLKLKRIPKLVFVIDKSAHHGKRLEQKLKEMEVRKK